MIRNLFQMSFLWSFVWPSLLVLGGSLAIASIANTHSVGFVCNSVSDFRALPQFHGEGYFIPLKQDQVQGQFKGFFLPAGKGGEFEGEALIFQGETRFYPARELFPEEVTVLSFRSGTSVAHLSLGGTQWSSRIQVGGVWYKSTCYFDKQ